MDYSKVSKDQAIKLRQLNNRIELANIPSSSLDESLNVATWNIRDFGKSRRSDDGILFIAQILYQFDLIAITEVRDDLTDFKRVLNLLGPNWKFVINDWQPDRAGNRERVAFLYDERMVNFTGLAAEAAPARKKIDGDYYTNQSWWRSPYFASFSAGQFDFILMAMHARWGTTEGRIDELNGFGNWIKKRWEDNEDKVFDKDLIVVGDFNIPSNDDRFYQALTVESKLKMPDNLKGINDTAAAQGTPKNYDQILHRCDQVSFSGRGGVIDFSKDQFMETVLFPELTFKEATFQLSDHFPLWLQIKTNNDQVRLDNIIGSDV
ncbi:MULTISPECIES: endonuclease/exonuclease/phosphatase family protein [Pseudoalteromonas]|uniref:Putative extracellular nuclease n=1 Tax=Pseudoalteromonas luteoviolacea (strain 2ta16) TaxID=1353533 RepID=V4I458_PSEL2|nr:MULTISPECIES: endonuclease/exonuclease/phosphatase family protein [Pseudoalteromonas]ESP95034.1 putative extracellular nuclease [Pseudoalteromonas luteoviolacea 2ta16]KZN34146.1 hypothetical protein N483_25355 [Pseudoalteromonas luteoviolacea NCIMB 1944]MCG7550079.1 endonuclease/exonuclease/phosphatase family protein [Pseudoalteromonas sp. Of7M-16]